MRIEKPLNEQQLKSGDLIAPGIYNFEVMDALETQSKAGNDMLKLQLKVFMEDGRERIVFDYLLEALQYKLGHFAEVIGMVNKYNEGALSAEDCFGKSGQLKIGIQSDKTGQYGDRNTVLDYVMPLEKKMDAVKNDSKDFVDSEIPF